MLTAAQIETFESSGYVRLPGLFSADEVRSFVAAIDNLRRTGATTQDDRTWWGAVQPSGHAPATRQRWELRNVAMAAPLFMGLVDCEALLVPAVQILGPRIALLSSHAMVRGQSSELSPAEVDTRRLAWHRDLGISSIELPHPHPRLAIKAAIWLSTLDGPYQGAMRVVPGSHRLVGDLVYDDATCQPFGAIEVLAEPGDVLLFEQRLWHAAAPNLSTRPRVCLFYSYGYRWLRPQDYGDLSADQLADMPPIRRQLFGQRVTAMSFHLPTPADVPLDAWYHERMGDRA